MAFFVFPSTLRNANAKIDRLTTELAVMRARLQSADEELRDTRSAAIVELLSLGDVLQSKNADIARLTSELVTARARVRSTEEELKDARTTLAASQGAVDDFESRNRALLATLGQTRDLLDARTAELEDARKHLNARTAELEAVQTLLKKNETFTAVRIAEAVNGINRKARQIAVALVGAGDSIRGEDSLEWAEEERVEEARRWIGARMVEVLRSADNVRDPLVLEMALRACVVTVVLRVVVRSFLDGDADDDGTGGRYAAGTFRSHDDNDADTIDVCSTIASALSSIVLIARSSRSTTALSTAPPARVSSPYLPPLPPLSLAPLPSFTAALSPSSPASPNFATAPNSPSFATSPTLYEPPPIVRSGLKSRILDVVGDRLRALVDGCFALKCGIGEGGEGAEFVPFVVVPGARYDKESMVEEGMVDGQDGEGRGERADRVLCSLGLGLRRDVEREGGKVESELLVKPEVVLGAVDWMAGWT